MDETISQLIKALVSKADGTTLALIFVIVVEAWLLLKAVGRVDDLVKELGKNSQTLATLTELLNHLIYGRKK